MRSLILLYTIGFLSSIISAQNFEVVTTYPGDGTFGVTTDSILITFSMPLSINLDDDELEESGFYAGLEPEDSFEPDSLALSEDGHTLKFFGTFEDDTDFILYIMGAVSQSGVELSSPYVMQFSTADTRGEFVIQGFLDEDILDQLVLDDFNGFTTFLSYTAPQFMFYRDDEDDHEEEDNIDSNTTYSKSYNSPFYSVTNDEPGNGDEQEDDVIPVYGTLVNPETGEYVITGVREGVYYPLGYNLFEIAEFEMADNDGGEGEYEFFFPTTLRYDANGDLGIDSIVVNSTELPTDTLKNTDLSVLDLDPFGIKSAFDIVETTIDVNGLGEWEIIGGFAEYKLSNYFYDYFYESASVNDYEPFFFQVVDGLSDVWSIIAYEANIDSAALFIVTPIGAELLDIIGEDVDEPVDFSEIIPVPENSLTSIEAFEIMLDEGLISAYNNIEHVFGPDFYWDFEFQLLHEYWNYTPDPTPTAPVTWKGTLYADYYDEGDQRNYYAEYTIHIDPVTGDVLYEEATDIPDVETISLFDYLLPNGNVNPSGDSLVFIFDDELDLNLGAMDPEDMGISLFIEPEDSVEITDITYAEGDGGSIVTVFVNLTEDTDYVVFLAEVNGAEGEILDQPYVLQFTTGDPSNRFTISGYLETPDIDINNYFRNMVVMLVEEEPEFGFDFFDEEEDDNGESDELHDGHEEDEDDFIPTYAANVDPESGYFEISLIREGEYYPIAFDVSDMGDEEEFNGEFYIPKIFYYDGNEDRYPDELEINSTVAPTDTLSDLELAALKFDRFTLSEAIELTERRIDALEIGDVEFMGGATFFQFYGFEDMGFEKGLKSMPQAIIQDHHEGPMDSPFFMEPDGRNFIWQIFVYHPAKDSALMTMVTPIGAMFEGYLGEDDIEENIEFDDLKVLPEVYIDSDSAAFRFAEEGGDAFIEFLEDTYETGSYYWFHEIQALHEYWDYPFGSSPDEPIAWKARYESYAFDQMTGTQYVDSLVIYLDVVSGDVLFTELSVDNEIELDTPQKIQLGQNYPNPFNPSTNIPFELSKSSVVNIEIFNLLGQKVATLTNELYSAGRHTIAWNATNYSSGIYFYRLTAGDVIQTKKLMLIK
jgi:hypothetical protein